MTPIVTKRLRFIACTLCFIAEIGCAPGEKGSTTTSSSQDERDQANARLIRDMLTLDGGVVATLGNGVQCVGEGGENLYSTTAVDVQFSTVDHLVSIGDNDRLIVVASDQKQSNEHAYQVTRVKEDATASQVSCTDFDSVGGTIALVKVGDFERVKNVVEEQQFFDEVNTASPVDSLRELTLSSSSEQ